MGIILLIFSGYVVFSVWSVHAFYREGWEHGYSAGYSDRNDETVYGEPYGTRDGRTTL